LILKILHRHILGSLLINLMATLVVFTFVLLLGNIFKDILALLGNQTVGLLTLGHFFLLLLPYVLSLSLPMALLAATLLVVGRVSADNELTAARSCGVSLVELMLPILGMAAVLSFVSLYMNCSLAPRTKYLFNQAFVKIAYEHPLALLEEGRYITEFENMKIFIGKRDVAKRKLEDVRVTILGDKDVQDIHAQSGNVSWDSDQLKLKIVLLNAQVDQWDAADPSNFDKRQWGMTFESFPIELDMTKLVDQHRGEKDDHHYTSMELWRQAVELNAQGGGNPTPKLVELHKRVALSLACISFVLVGLPLGIQVHRRETSIGILISLVLAVLYYFLMFIAESLKRNPHLYPELIIWLPNLIFQGVGIYLLWKQNKV
jgi:lipopolysaccharide export system permease protein